MVKFDETTSTAWHQFIQRLESEFGTETIDKWVRPLTIKQAEYLKLVLEAKDSFQVLWFEEHIRPKISTFVDPMGTPIKISIQSKTFTKKPPQKKIEQQKSFLSFSDLKSNLSFEHFILQTDNKLIIALLEELCTHLTSEQIQSLSSLVAAEKSPPPPNPVYIYGPSGSGKTHLLNATALRLRNAGLRVIMEKAETFTDHVVKGIRAGEMTSFRNLWRTADVLFVDDIHHLARKSTTQEEFFHTFNTLHVAGKQIILAANCQPGQLQFIEPRLVSRFEWGIVLPVHTLPKKLFPRLLEKKAALLKSSLPQSFIQSLSEIFSSSPSSAVHALEVLISRLRISKQIKTLSLSHARDLLADLIVQEQHLALTHNKILDITAQSYGITVEDLLGKSQNRESVLPRQISMYLMRKHLRLPFMKIGDLFTKNHSTVMSAVRQIEKSISNKHSDVGSAIASIEISLSELVK